MSHNTWHSGASEFKFKVARVKRVHSDVTVLSTTTVTGNKIEKNPQKIECVKN